MSNPRSGPTCPKCGKPVLAEEKYRLRYGDVEHTYCDAIQPAAPLPAITAQGEEKK